MTDESKIESTLNLFNKRIASTTDDKLRGDLAMSLDGFKVRLARYQDLCAKETTSSKLPEELLEAELNVAEHLLGLTDGGLKKLYSEFPQRVANYPDAVNAMKKRWSHMQPPISVTTRMEMPGKIRKLNSLSHFSVLDPDLFSGAIKLLCTMINSDSYNMMASLGKRNG